MSQSDPVTVLNITGDRLTLCEFHSIALPLGSKLVYLIDVSLCMWM